MRLTADAKERLFENSATHTNEETLASAPARTTNGADANADVRSPPNRGQAAKPGYRSHKAINAEKGILHLRSLL